MPGKSSKSPSEEQVERFIETARELGCEDDEDAFVEKLRRVAQHKPPQPPKREKKPKG